MRMSRKIKLTVAALAVAGVLVAVFAVPAFAADPPATGTPTPTQAYCPGYGSAISGDVSALLKLAPEEIQAQLNAGKTLAEVAAAQGVTEDALVKAILADRAAFMQQRVQDSAMTQEQVDLMLKHMEQFTRDAVNRKYTGQPGTGFGPGGMMGGAGGMMGGWGGAPQTGGGTSFGGRGSGMMGGGGMMRGWGYN